MSLIEFAQEVGKQLGRDYRHQRTPIDAVARALELARHGQRSVFDVFLSYLPAEKGNYDFHLGNIPIEPKIVRGPEANPLAIYITESNISRPVLFEFAFNPAYLTRTEVERFQIELMLALDSFIDDPTTAVAAIESGVDAVVDEAITGPASPENVGATPNDTCPVLRVAGSFTAEPVGPSLQFWMRRLGANVVIEHAGYNQIFQELLDPGSGMRNSTSGCNILLLRVEDWLRERPEAIRRVECPDDRDFLLTVAGEFIEAIATAARNSIVPYVVMICPPSPLWSKGGPCSADQISVENAIAAGLTPMTGVHLLSYSEGRRLYQVLENSMQWGTGSGTSRTHRRFLLESVRSSHA